MLALRAWLPLRSSAVTILSAVHLAVQSLKLLQFLMVSSSLWRKFFAVRNFVPTPKPAMVSRHSGTTLKAIENMALCPLLPTQAISC
jgi:hypothetical protein